MRIEWRSPITASASTSGAERPETEIHPDDIDRVKAQFERSLISGAASELEMEKRLRGGDGTYRWFLVRYNPLRDDQGQIVRWYIAGTDIEDRKRGEDKLQQENVALREEIDKTSMFEEIVGASPALTAVLSQVSKVAGSESTVLITGETGTGKELVARAIHRRSRRASRAFVAVNCAAIPRDLIASELFGHEKGAFTGALQRRLGRFELADGGTIFLDEVGELASDTQVALLRVLQEREFERVGGQQPIRVDVRVIAATNRDLTEAVADGTFRQDLFYRLNVFPLEMPPLRARQEDIAVLVEYFIDRYARKAGKTIRRVSKRTLDLPEVVSVAWERPRIAKRHRAVGDRVGHRRIHRRRELVVHATRGGEPARHVQHAGVTREGAHRRRAAGHRRARVRAHGSSGTTRHSTFNAGIEDSHAEDQQEPLSHASAKAFLKERSVRQVNLLQETRHSGGRCADSSGAGQLLLR